MPRATAALAAIALLGGVGALGALGAACGGGGGVSREAPPPGPESDAGDGAAPGPVDPTNDPQLAALRALERASLRPVSVSFHHGFPTSIVAAVPAPGADDGARARWFVDTYRALFRQDGADLALRGSRVEGSGGAVVVFEQTFRGLPVFGGQLSVRLDGGVVGAVSGALVTKDLVLRDLAPKIGAADAEAIARTFVGAPASAPARGKTTLTIYDRSLVDVDAAREPHVAYRARVGGWVVLVDAQHGQALAALPTTENDFDLDQETANGNQAEDSGCYWNTTDDDQVGDEDGVYAPYAADARITKLNAYARAAYGFYLGAFGRRSYDGSDAQIEAYNHVKTPYPRGASWIADCDLFEVSDTFVAQDVFAHELTHAVIDHTSHLFYLGQSGALNESYADLMGELAEGTPDWLEAASSQNGVVRSLSDPTKYGQPDRFSAFVARPLTAAGDYGGVHANSGIANKAGYLLVEGGSFDGFDVEGVGLEKGRQIVYATMYSVALMASFAMNRDVMVGIAASWAAAGLYGFTARDLCAVRNAWASVEIGAPDRDCDGHEEPPGSDLDHDYVLDAADLCPLVADPVQPDTDGDGKGDACDPDDDDDGVPDTEDDCDERKNPDQKDVNGDGVGDACQDFDGDGVLDPDDDCPGDPDTEQLDSDGDGDGDACDLDLDGDGVTGLSDDCPFVANADQSDADMDGVGDACDPCPGVKDDVTSWTSGIPELGIAPKPVTADHDGDGVPDACDAEPLGSSVTATVDAQPVVVSKPALAPDGATHTVNVGGPASSSFQLPIAACAGPCPEWFAPNARVTLAFEQLDPRVGVWIADDTGRPVVRVHQRSRATPVTRTVSFAPRGGRTYSLVFELAPDFAATAPTSAFAVTMSSTTM